MAAYTVPLWALLHLPQIAETVPHSPESVGGRAAILYRAHMRAEPRRTDLRVVIVD